MKLAYTELERLVQGIQDAESAITGQFELIDAKIRVKIDSLECILHYKHHQWVTEILDPAPPDDDD